MPRVNIYLPDGLAKKAKAAGINLSRLTQEALQRALGVDETHAWLDSVAALGRTSVSHEQVLQAVREARRELGAEP